MKKKTVVIIEDELYTSKDLEEILQGQGYNVLEVFDKAETAIKRIPELMPDAILVDINLKGDMTGVELMESIDHLEIPFIYLTANTDQKTINRVVNTDPSAYISKPFDEIDVIIAMEIASSKNDQSEDLTLAGKNIFVKSGQAYEKLDIEKILYILAEGSYSVIHTEIKSYTLSNNLNNILNQVNNHNLMRIHRSCVVNIEYVTKFDNDYVYIGDKSFVIGKTYKIPVKNRFLKIS